MRTAFAALAVMLALLLIVNAQGAPTQRDVSSWVEECLNRDTEEKRRDELVSKLRSVDRLLLQKPLRTAIADEKKRPIALRMGLHLTIPGLFDGAKKFVDGDDEDVIVQLALATLDKGAAQWAFDRWKATNEDEASWAVVQAAFVAYCVPLDILVQFKNYITAKDSVEKKRDGAATILRFQLGVDDLERPEEFVAKWADLKSAYESDAKAFKIAGTDLLAASGWQTSGKTIKVGGNLRLGVETNMNLTAPAEWNKGNFTVTMRVRVVSGNGARFILQTEQGGWSPQLDDGDWVVKEGHESEFATPVKTGEWNTFVWAITDESSDTQRNRRFCKLTINDKVIMDKGMLNGKFEGLRFETDKTKVVVGGVDLVKSSK